MGKMMNDLISVVVTCYNHEKYIEQCLRSIFSQTYSKIELLVLDDGSMDSSSEIIQEVLKDSPFATTYFDKHENMGLVRTRNKALSLIKGEFFLFVDSDDFLEDDYIEKLYDVAVKEEADIVYCDLYDFEKQENFLTSKEFDLLELLRANYISSCSLVRTKASTGILYDTRLSGKKLEDYDFFLNLIINNKAKAVYQSQTRLNYRVLPTSMSQRDSTKYYYEVYLLLLEKYLDKLPHEIYHALGENIFTLEGRLDALIHHHEKVSEYVQELQNQNHTLEDVLSKEKCQSYKLREHIKMVNQEVLDVKSSLSYRLGNALINPIKILAMLVRNPRALRPILSQIKRNLIWMKRRLSSPKVYYNRFVRDQERKQLATNGKRALVYVIFESEERLQDYKVRFLESLSKLSDDVLVIVNGDLQEEDIHMLESYGQVFVRENVGYDTAAFRDGIKAFGKETLKQYAQLLLVNDTNIGPMRDMAEIFQKMEEKHLDFWGISFGEEQEDVTGENPYGYIPKHLQSYFLVIENLLLQSDAFYAYWDQLQDTDSRDKAIGRHETVFTKYFADLGYRYDALVQENEDSAMYIHPLRMLEAGSPLVKYTALKNYDDEQFSWQGLDRESEVPELLEYVASKTDYPVEILENIVDKFQETPDNQYILIIDGVENIIPQCTRYRVLNKAEQLRKNGFEVRVVNASAFDLSMAQYASQIIIYRAPISPLLLRLCQLAKEYGKPVYFDIDDLVFDTVYTDQLSYTQGLSPVDKGHYDASVRNYGLMLEHCDAAITSTLQLQTELLKYKDKVLLNRNLASDELIEISRQSMKDYSQQDTKIKIGYFSGSISHNENFELVKPAIKELLSEHHNLELHIVGHLDIPEDMKIFQKQIVVHNYVNWDALPSLISRVDINLAPLVDSIFNRAKSEIKWMEAALVKVPTVASNMGAFADMVVDGETGLLADDDQWFEKLNSLIESASLRQQLAQNAYDKVVRDCSLNQKDEMVSDFETNK